MKKKKPTLKKLPKFELGATYDPNVDPNNPATRNQAGTEQNIVFGQSQGYQQPITNGQQSSGVYSDGNTGQTYGTTGFSDSMNNNSGYISQVGNLASATENRANYSSANNAMYAKEDATWNTVGQFGAIGQVIKGGAQLGNAIGRPVRNKNEAKAGTDGYKKHLTIGGGMINPLSALQTRASYDGGWTDIDGSKYEAHLQNQNAQNNQFPMGGINGLPNAEVELQENTIAPDGEFTQHNGPSHDMGGIPVNMEPGERIYSDRLKMPGTKKTFAALNKANNTKKQDKVLEDSYSTSTAKSTAKLVADIKRKKSEQLFATQEALKQSKVQAYAKKMGLNPDNFAMGGTKLPKYVWGGTDGEPELPFGSNNERGNMLAADNTGGNNPMYTQADIDALVNNSQRVANQQIVNQDDKYMVDSGNKSRQFVANQIVPKSSYNNISDPNTQGHDINQANPNTTPSGNKFDWRTPAGAGFGAGVQSIDELMYLKDHGKRYDKVDYGTVTPEKLNPREAILQAQMQARITRNALKDQTGGNVGSYLSNLTGAQAVNSMNIANIQQTYDNQNAGIANQAKYANQGYKMQGMADEAANKGQALTNYYQAIGEIGNNTAGAYKDYKAGKMDMNTAKMLSSMFTNYGLDMNNPNHWTIAYKKYQEQNNVPDNTAIPQNPSRTKYGRSSGSYSSKQTKKD